MKKILRILILSSILLLSTEAKEIKTVTEAINIAGKQRMLTQRMLADYAMMGMHSTFKNPEKDLSKCMGEFDENLQALSAYSQDKMVTKKLDEVKSLWSTVKISLKKEPSLQICKTLCDDLDKLLLRADNVVQEIKKQSTDKAAAIVDLSGRQRMLSQRIAGLYILNMWATNNEVYKKRLNEAMVLFKRSMDQLKTYNKNTDEIKALIAKVEKSYGYLAKMRTVGASMKVMPSLVYNKLDGMLVNMHKVTGLYASIK